MQWRASLIVLSATAVTAVASLAAQSTTPKSDPSLEAKHRVVNDLFSSFNPSGNLRFTAVGAPLEVRFERDRSGRVSGFVIDSGDITGIPFVKLQSPGPTSR